MAKPEKTTPEAVETPAPPPPAEGKPVPGDNIPPVDVIPGIPKKPEAEAAEQTGQEQKPLGDKAPEKKDGPPKVPPKDKADKPGKGAAPRNPSAQKKSKSKPPKEKKPKPQKPAKEKAEPPQPEPPAPPPEPRSAPGSDEEQKIVYLNHDEVHPFKGHPFQVKDDAEMRALVSSVAEKGVEQAGTVRPREGGGYELVVGHRRQRASELAGFTNMPYVIRDLTDDEAIRLMVETNVTYRGELLPSERAKALDMQLEAIKRQGARDGGDEKGQRSNRIVAERNNMSVKNVQRYISLNKLIPDLMKMADAKKIGFTVAVELAAIRPKHQRYIAVAIEAQQSSPAYQQAKRMKELDQKNILQPDMIDGIMTEGKKEVDQVIISTQELAQFFGPDKTPREMKDKILKLLEEDKAKNPPELGKTGKNQDEQEK